MAPGADGGNGDALNWKILIAVIAIAAVASSIFGAGILYGGVATKKEVADTKKQIDENYLRKDGRELEGIRNELRNMDRSLSELTIEVRGMRK